MLCQCGALASVPSFTRESRTGPRGPSGSVPKEPLRVGSEVPSFRCLLCREFARGCPRFDGARTRVPCISEVEGPHPRLSSAFNTEDAVAASRYSDLRKMVRAFVAVRTWMHAAERLPLEAHVIEYCDRCIVAKLRADTQASLRARLLPRLVEPLVEPCSAQQYTDSDDHGVHGDVSTHWPERLRHACPMEALAAR